jgi:hypothetical protein
MKTIGKVNGENGYPGHPARSTESEMQTQDDLVELTKKEWISTARNVWRWGAARIIETPG